jgi:hypothetical protein
MRGRALFALFILAAAAASAQTPPATAPPVSPQPTLPGVIALEETVGDQRVAPIPMTGEIKEIDGRSNVAVTVHAPNGGVAGFTTEAVAAAADLRSAVDEASQGYRIVAQMLTLPSDDRATNSPQWNAMAAEVAAKLGGFAASAQRYIDKLNAAQDPALREHAAVFQRRIRNAILTGNPDVAFVSGQSIGSTADRTKIPDFLEEELRWINDWITGKTEEITSTSPQLFLAATLNHKGTTTPVGLEGYNDIPIGPQIPFKAINLVPTAEQQSEMKAALDESTKLAASFNELKSSKAKLRDVLRAGGIDFTALQTSFINAKAAIRSVGTDAGLQQLATDVGKAFDAGVAAAATPQQKQLLGDLRTQATTLIAAAKNARSSLAAIERGIDLLRPAVVSTNLQAQGDPVDAVVALLQTVPNAGLLTDLKQIRTDVITVAPTLRQIQMTLSELSSGIDQLPSAARSAVTTVVTDRVTATFAPLATALGDLQKQVEPILDAAGALSNNRALAGLVVTSDTPPPSSKGMSLAAALPTTIPITTLPRVEGDVVTLQAWLYQQDPNDPTKSRLIEAKAQPIEIVAFGWGTTPNVGVAYATARFKPSADADPTRTFAPQVSWMLGYRPRGGIFAGEKLFGVGLHAVSFDLDKNNQLELGVGVTVSTLADFVYVGYGSDLTLKNKRYWFLGTRLFQLAQKIGFKVSQ